MSIFVAFLENMNFIQSNKIFSKDSNFFSVSTIMFLFRKKNLLQEWKAYLISISSYGQKQEPDLAVELLHRQFTVPFLSRW